MVQYINNINIKNKIFDNSKKDDYKKFKISKENFIQMFLILLIITTIIISFYFVFYYRKKKLEI